MDNYGQFWIKNSIAREPIFMSFKYLIFMYKKGELRVECDQFPPSDIKKIDIGFYVSLFNKII